MHKLKCTLITLVVIVLLTVPCNLPFSSSTNANSSDNECPMFHNDSQHSGYSISIAPITNNTLWSYETAGYATTSPAVADGNVFVGSADDKVCAFGDSSAQFLSSWSKYQGNPLNLDAGIGSFSILHDENVYKIWYSSPDGKSIKYATSSDGITWAVHGTVLSPGPDDWDKLSAVAPTVVYNGSVYLMWYRGYPYHEGPQAYGLAVSPDGISWTKYSKNPVLSPSPNGWDSKQIGGATVLLDGSTYRMWYHATSDGQSNDIGYATSTNGVTWQKYSSNPVIKHGETGNWESSWNIGIGGSSIIKEGSTFKMWYTSVDTQFGNWQIGSTNSTDGIHWGETTPALSPESGKWDGFYVANPAVLLVGDSYQMWYIGDDDGQLNNDKLGLAYASAPITTPKKLAVVIGIEDYGDEFWGILDPENRVGPARSASQIFDLLVKNFGFSSQNINDGAGVLIDPHPSLSNDDITEDKIREEINWLRANAGPQDDVLLYYAGHGSRLDGQEFLIAHGDRAGTLPITDSELARMLNSINCRTLIVILDMSYAGGFIKDNGQWSDLALDSSGKLASNRIVLTSCGEVTQDDEDTKALVFWENEMAFTHFLTEGFRHDANNDGKTSIEEAFYYAADQFPTTDGWGLRKILQEPQIYDGYPKAADNIGEYILGATVAPPETTLPITAFWVQCPVDLHVYDSAGHHVGLDSSGRPEIGFEADFIELNESQLIIVRNATETYRVKLVGTDEGSFNLTVSTIENDQIAKSSSQIGVVFKGQTIEYETKTSSEKVEIIAIESNYVWTYWLILTAGIVIGLSIIILAVLSHRKRQRVGVI